MGYITDSVLNPFDGNILTYFFLFYNHFFVFPGSPNRVRGRFSEPGSREQPASPFFAFPPGFSQPGSREQPASPFFAFFPGSPNPVRRYRYSEKKVAPLAGCDPDCFYFNLNIELFIVVYNITKFCLKRCSTYKTSVDVWLSE